MKLRFWETNYAAGSGYADSDFLFSYLNRKTEGKLRPVDRGYLILQERLLGKLVAAHVTVHRQMRYGSNLRSKEDSFPDCDDFAYAALGQFIIGSGRSSLERCPAFGYLEYTRKADGAAHAANFGIVAPVMLLVYEPQTGQWKRWEDEVASVAMAALA